MVKLLRLKYIPHCWEWFFYSLGCKLNENDECFFLCSRANLTINILNTWLSKNSTETVKKVTKPAYLYWEPWASLKRPWTWQHILAVFKLRVFKVIKINLNGQVSWKNNQWQFLHEQNHLHDKQPHSCICSKENYYLNTIKGPVIYYRGGCRWDWRWGQEL